MVSLLLPLSEFLSLCGSSDVPQSDENAFAFCSWVRGRLLSRGSVFVLHALAFTIRHSF